MAYTGKFTDRNPSLKAAGISSVKENEKIADCFVHEVCAEEAAPILNKPEPVDYKLPPPRVDIYKGFNSDMRECLQPDVNKGLGDTLDRECRETVADSSWKKSTSGVADQDPIVKDVGIGVRRPPSRNPGFPGVCVQEQSRDNHEMYKKSHNNYEPGEQINRNFLEPFNRNLTWGKETPNDPLGGCVKRLLTPTEDENDLVSKILSDHRNRTKLEVGKVHAPNHNIQCVPLGHSFGRLNKRGVYGVGELLKDCDANLDKQDLFDELSHVNTLRNQIARRGSNFPHGDLLDTLHRLDTNNSKRLHLNTTLEVLAGFQINPEKTLFEDLLKRLNILTNDGTVDYEKMAGIFNVQTVFPDITKLEDVPSDMLSFETTSQCAQKYHQSGNFETTGIPTAGLPPGDHVAIESIVSPSIFTTYGLEPSEFFVPRSPGFIRTLLENYQLDDHRFQEIWNAAKDENGSVTVSSFLKAYTTSKECL